MEMHDLIQEKYVEAGESRQAKDHQHKGREKKRNSHRQNENGHLEQ